MNKSSEEVVELLREKDDCEKPRLLYMWIKQELISLKTFTKLIDITLPESICEACGGSGYFMSFSPLGGTHKTCSQCLGKGKR